MALKRVYIEITNRCNLRCSFCPATVRPAGTMAVEDFEKIAKMVVEHTPHVYLHVKGEPLTHPQFGEIMNICTKYGLLVNLTTNGTLLGKQEHLLPANPALRQTNLSIHGYTEKTHGPLQSWINHLITYSKLASEQGKFTVFRFWTLGKNRKAEGHDLEAIRMLEKHFDKVGEIEHALHTRSIPLAKGIFVSFDEEFQWPNLDNDYLGDRGCCYGTRTMLGILVDGSVVPCCLDGDGCCILGNIYEDTLDDIIQSNKYQSMAQSFTNRKVIDPLCQHCGYRTRFGTT